VADTEPNVFPLTATNPGAAPAQFLDILGDILPRGEFPQGQPGASQSPAQLSGMTLGSSYEVSASQVFEAPVNNEVQPGSAETVATNATAAGSSQPAHDATPNAAPQASGTRNVFWRQAAAGNNAVLEPERNAAEPASVAFAARISARTPEPQMIAPNEAQAAIAAARFRGLEGDLAPTHSQAAPVRDDRTASAARMAQQAAEPQGPEGEPVVIAVPGFEDMTLDDSSGEGQSKAQPNASARSGSAQVQSAGAGENGLARQAAAAASEPGAAPTPEAQAAAQPETSGPVTPQLAAVRVASTQAASRAIPARTSLAAREGSNPAPGTANASSGFAMTAPASGSAAGGRGATNAKPAQGERVTTFFEPQNEPAERAGEMVRAISLNLSSKDQNVQVRLSERAGELHVTVRTPDAGLTHGLREGLSDLVGRLEHGGFRAEAWRPAGSDASDRGQDSPSHRGSSQQQNDRGRGQRENSQDPESEAQIPKWMGELESSFQRSNSVWPPSAVR
jgi:hypothetical protein